MEINTRTTNKYVFSNLNKNKNNNRIDKKSAACQLRIIFHLKHALAIISINVTVTDRELSKKSFISFSPRSKNNNNSNNKREHA